MRRPRVRGLRQSGIALLALLGVLALGATAVLVTKLNTASAQFDLVRKQRNAEVLRRAKSALVGYIAAQAAKAYENDPGAFPCPEPGGYFDSTTQDGQMASFCSAPAVGRFPWRSIGTEKFVDADGEPLWYVVGANWARPSAGANTLINSDSAGQLTVDGTANAAIAIIVAPGPAITVTASTGCTAWVQTRPTTGTPDLRNYLECENATSPADATFVSTRTSGTFNDQVIAITVADVMPAIEAAIANRVEREIAPLLKSVYAGSEWGNSSAAPAFAFPAPFANTSTSSFTGQAGTYQGLLPFNYHSASCGGNVRCSTNVVSWNAAPSFATTGPGYLPSGVSCYYSAPYAICEGYYYGGSMGMTLTDRANNITTGLRTLNASTHTGNYRAWQWNGFTWVYLGQGNASTSRSLRSDGNLDFVATGTLPSIPAWGYFTFFINRPADNQFGDHALLDSNDATTGWFVRNEWYKVMYYAIAPGFAPGGGAACSDSGSITCVQVTNMADPTKQRAVVALTGRALSSLGQSRPSSALQNYLDASENTDLDRIFVQSKVGSAFNDRFVSEAKNP